MTDQEKFITQFNNCFVEYKKYKKDYLLVSLLHYQFKKENPEFSKDLLDSKLKILINTYRVKRNKNFDHEKYSACNFIWENLNQYITNVFALVSEKKLKDTYLEDFDKQYLDDIENILDDLNIGINTNSSKNIQKIINKLKN